jgi:hypothetical protein
MGAKAPGIEAALAEQAGRRCAADSGFTIHGIDSVAG